VTRVKFLYALILASQLMSGQSDSLRMAFESATDLTMIKKIASQITEACNRDLTCLDQFMAEMEIPPVTEKKMLGFLSVAGIHQRISKPALTITIYKRGVVYATALAPHHTELGIIYNNLGTLFKFNNQLDSALYYIQLAENEFRFHQQIHDYWRIPFSRYMVYLELKDYKRADAYLRQSFFLLPKDAKRGDRGFLLFTLMSASEARGTQEEFDFYLDAFIRFKAEGNSKTLDPRHMGLLEFFGEGEKAIKMLEDRIQQAINDSLSVNPDLTYLTLAVKYMNVGKYQKALDVLEEGKYSLYGTITADKDRQQLYYTIYKKMGQPEKAYEAIERYVNLQDSSYQQILNTRLAEYEVKFHTQEQERNLIEKDLQLTRSKLYQRSYVGLSGILGLSLLGGIVFYRRKLNYQHQMTAKEAEIQTQRIRELEHKNTLLSLNAIIEGQEAERLRIAQDLHDGLGGLLTTVKAHFNSIQREIDNIKNLNVYEKTNKLIDEACDEVRRIAHDMVPYSIKISGLIGAMEDLRQSIIARGPDCELEMHGLDEIKIDEHKTNMIYRVIQEITNNAVKHAHASRIFIQLLRHESTLHVLVEDNGRGFDINQVVSNKGIGLKSIDSRVHYLGGKINFDSTPGQGTTVNIEIPL